MKKFEELALDFMTVVLSKQLVEAGEHELAERAKAASFDTLENVCLEIGHKQTEYDDEGDDRYNDELDCIADELEHFWRECEWQEGVEAITEVGQRLIEYAGGKGHTEFVEKWADWKMDPDEYTGH